jgi:hypothetical protein
MTVDTIGWNTTQRRAFGELTARSWLDADFRLRYEREPFSVLAEYNVRLADGVGAPALPPEPGGELVIEILDGSEVLPPPPPCMYGICFCLYTWGRDSR